MTSDRERFEAWYLKKYWLGSDSGRAYLGKEECGGYTYAMPQELWDVWQAAQPAAGTTSDQYRAELYDEVWQKARDMGYGNVTDALVELERMKATQPAAGEPAAWECVHGGYVSLSYEKEGDPERAVPLFRSAPPAASHGDEAVLDHPVIKLLLEVALSADHALDDTEDDGENLTWWRSSFERLSNAMDALAQLPDDQPDVVMGPAAKAAWALRGMTAMRAQAGEGGE